MKFLKFQQFGWFFTNVESCGNEVDYVCTYVKTYLFILLSLWAFVVIFYIILLRTSKIRISQKNLKLQGKVWRNYDISIGYSCTGKGPNSKSFWGFSPDLTWRAYSVPWIPPAVLQPELLAPPLFRNHVSAPVIRFNIY